MPLDVKKICSCLFSLKYQQRSKLNVLMFGVPPQYHVVKHETSQHTHKQALHTILMKWGSCFSIECFIIKPQLWRPAEGLVL